MNKGLSFIGALCFLLAGASYIYNTTNDCVILGSDNLHAEVWAQLGTTGNGGTTGGNSSGGGTIYGGYCGECGGKYCISGCPFFIGPPPPCATSVTSDRSFFTLKDYMHSVSFTCGGSGKTKCTSGGKYIIYTFVAGANPSTYGWIGEQFADLTINTTCE